ncbi:hypothetical protein T4D_13579 [Trichinella pseudospiralis]|uniref:Uncharacterized protein n=2 Tax=Trichinella pseudospiralis TaxID=6337 RepID=A0A0V1F389_TRIPS|nr:hypothetical protein T4D_13579 [Trichinella pseudospiralis]
MTFPTCNAVKPSGRLFCFSTTCIKNCDSVFPRKTSIRYTNNFVSSSPNSWFELLPWTFYPPDYALAAGPLGICISSFEDAYDGFPYCQAVQVTQCLMPKRLCSSLYGADLLALGSCCCLVGVENRCLVEASRAREMLSMRMNGTEANKPQEGGESPLMCLLLIPSHFGKISHQGDCGGANICSYTFCLSHDILGRGISVVLMYTPVLFAYPITFWDVTWGIAVVLMSTPVLSLNPVTFWDNKSTGGMCGGDATSSLLAYPITFWDSKSAGELPLC